MDRIIKFLAYLIIVVTFLFFIDFVLFSKVLDLGASRFRANLENKHLFVPYPYVGFVSKDIAMSEPYSQYYTGNKLYSDEEKRLK